MTAQVETRLLFGKTAFRNGRDRERNQPEPRGTTWLAIASTSW